MRRMMLMAALAASLVAGATAAVAGVAGSGPSDLVTTVTGMVPATTDTATTDTATTDTTLAGTRRREAGEDLSGPCDEAEHADDLRCTGAPAGGRDLDDDGHEDRSGRR